MTETVFGIGGVSFSLLNAVSDLMTPYIEPNETGNIFLDFGAGDSQLPEQVRDSLGLVYVGISYSRANIDSLSSRGFEAHQLPQGLPRSKVKEFVQSFLVDRKVKGIGFLGSITGELGLQDWLNILSSIARAQECPIILRANNIGHFDSSVQRILNIEPSLDVRLELPGEDFYCSEKSLTNAINRAGLEVIFKRDLLLDYSKDEQAQKHPLLRDDSIIRSLLRDLVTPDPQQSPLHFIWLCVPGITRSNNDTTLQFEKASRRPFATVGIRTQGDRALQLREALLCLGCQTFQDFEVLILLHSNNPVKSQLLELELTNLPSEFASKVRIIVVEGGSRTKPLNYALRQGVGEYFTFLDDDDYVLPNWLQEFYKLSLVGGGRVLRSQAVTQEHYQSEFLENFYTRSTSTISHQYSPDFSLAEHLIENQSPFMTLAFPRSLVDYLNFQFDEALSTTEDWDFFLRSASVLGVRNSTNVTSVYRQWTNAKSSSSIPRYEWEANKSTILTRLNAKPLILPPGEISALKLVIEKLVTERVEHETRLRLSEELNDESLVTLIRTLESRSWRWTAPLRALVNLLKKRKPLSLSVIDVRNRKQVQDLTSIIHSSFWWKISSPLRRI